MGVLRWDGARLWPGLTTQPPSKVRGAEMEEVVISRGNVDWLELEKQIRTALRGWKQDGEDAESAVPALYAIEDHLARITGRGGETSAWWQEEGK